MFIGTFQQISIWYINPLFLIGSPKTSRPVFWDLCILENPEIGLLKFTQESHWFQRSINLDEVDTYPRKRPNDHFLDIDFGKNPKDE
jgi:hypothetical protein